MTMQQATAQQHQLQADILDSTLVARVTQDPAEIRQAMALRYRVFAEDMGATVSGSEQGLDQDHFDEYCLHLIVKDIANDRVVGYSRILTNELAAKAGGFYSATEFDLSAILLPGKRYMEIGRTCVDTEFRSGSVIGLLWSGIAQFMAAHNIDYLMGCASIPLRDGYSRAVAIVNHLRDNHFTPEYLRATPKVPMPTVDTDLDGKALMPPLLKAYLRIGLKVCGEPCLDKAFNVADALILLDRKDMNQRYLRHFTRAEA